MKIKLKKEEKDILKKIIRKGKIKARSILRANILLLSDSGKKDIQIENDLNVARKTIYNIKNKFLLEGLDSALNEKDRPGQPKKYNDQHKVEVIATACTSAPKGRKRWTVRLIADELKKKKEFRTMNRESVRLILKKAKLSLG